MFDANSRYAKSPVVEVKAEGRNQAVKVVVLRRLPYTEGNLSEVSGKDQLDITAHRRYQDGTKFWHIADANTELQANDLVQPRCSENPLAKQETVFILIPGN